MSNVFPDQPDDVLLRALEQSPIIVVITDIRAIVQYVNPFFCKAKTAESIFVASIEPPRSVPSCPIDL